MIEATGIGVVVTAVKDASPGAKAGVKSGMRILRINGSDMARATKKDCVAAIKRSKVVDLELEAPAKSTK